MKKQNKQIGEELLQQTREDEERRMNSIKVDTLEEKPKSKKSTSYENEYANLNKGLFVNFEDRNKIRPKHNPNEENED